MRQHHFRKSFRNFKHVIREICKVVAVVIVSWNRFFAPVVRALHFFVSDIKVRKMVRALDFKSFTLEMKCQFVDTQYLSKCCLFL